MGSGGPFYYNYIPIICSKKCDPFHCQVVMGFFKKIVIKFMLMVFVKWSTRRPLGDH
jgi:hypothetical protein